MTHLAFVPQRQAVRHLSLEEMLIWAYRAQLVDRMSDRSLHGLEAAADGDREPHGRSADGVAQMVSVGNLGVRVDEFGGSWGASAVCHPDADALHDAVLSLGWTDAILIMDHARRGERPERSTIVPRPIPTPPDDGARPKEYGWHVDPATGARASHKIAVEERVAVALPIYEHRGRGRKQLVGHDWQSVDVLYCPLSWDPYPPGYLALVNAVFDRWTGALNRLAETIGGRVPFRDHVIGGVFRDGDIIA